METKEEEIGENCSQQPETVELRNVKDQGTVSLKMKNSNCRTFEESGTIRNQVVDNYSIRRYEGLAATARDKV